MQFHTIHKYLLLAHHPQQCEVLGRLIGRAHQHRPKELAHRMGTVHESVGHEGDGASSTLNCPAHLGYFKERLGAHEKAELLDMIGDYHHGRTPLIVPLTLIKHYVRIFDVGYIRDQVYLNPHPIEVMLRNHV